MPIKVYKVAEIIGSNVSFRTNRNFRVADLAAALTNLDPVAEPLPGHAWTLDLIIGEGPGRAVRIDLPPLIPRSYSPDVPLFIPGDTLGPLSFGLLIYFRDRLFMPERPPATALEREEIILRVKKATYEEEVELSSLRAAVANLEAVTEFQKSGPKRDPIPEDVKLLAWARDGGACVRCGSKQNLHFDHIIPVAKGGGNSETNIQILCQQCNLRKSDKIAVI